MSKYMEEADMHSCTTKAFNNMRDLKQATDRMSKFDASNSKFVVEYKSRGDRMYADTIIEKQKYDRCMADGRRFIYAIHVKDSIYYFDVSELESQNYDFGWETRAQPATTSFGRKEWIDKEVGYIKFTDAKYVVDKNTSKIIYR